MLRAAPAPSFLGFFLHRTKEDVKICRMCRHRFGAELLLPKGEPSFCHNCAQGKEGWEFHGAEVLRVTHSRSTQATGGAPSTALCSLSHDKLREHHLWAQQRPGHSAGEDTAASPCPGTNSDGQPPETRGCSCLQPGEGTPHLQAALWFPHPSLRYHPLRTSELLVWCFRVVATALFFQKISSE